MVELLTRTTLGSRIAERIADGELRAPAHLDAEVLSALGRLNRAGSLREAHVSICIEELSQAPIERHEIVSLLSGVWARRHNVSLRDGFYIELADRLQVPVITTDARLAAASSIAELVE